MFRWSRGKAIRVVCRRWSSTVRRNHCWNRASVEYLRSSATPSDAAASVNISRHSRNIEISHLRDTREQFFTFSSVKKLLQSVDSHTAIASIKEKHFYNQLWCLLFRFYISSIALVLHFLFILVSFHLILLLPTLWHLIAYIVLNTSLSDQISSVSISCCYHVYQLRCNRPYLDTKTASTIAISIVHSKLDGRGTLAILLFIAGRGRKAYWKRGVGWEGEGAEPINSWMHAIG